MNRLTTSDDDARAVLAALPDAERAAIARDASKILLFQGQVARAARLAEALLEVGPETIEGLVVAEDVLLEFGDRARCVQIAERLVDLSDEAEPYVARLALRLLDVERPEEALEVLDVTNSHGVDSAFARAATLAELERPEEALTIVRSLIIHQRKQQRFATNDIDWKVAADRIAQAHPLYDSLVSELEGVEQLVVTAMQRGELDTRDASNFERLAESLMVASDYVPSETSLRSPESALSLGYDGLDAWSMCRFASAKLRAGAVREAKRLFERARDLDGRCFAAYRGLAAVGYVERTRPFERVHSLPRHPIPDGLPQVIADWRNLTETEARIVTASAYPLRAALGALSEADARCVLLPIDVRTVDLAEFVPGSLAPGTDDLRSIDAIGGVADPTSRLALSRIEHLLDLSEHGLVFAHEFAHLVYFTFPPDNPFRALYEWARARPHVTSSYELSSEDEFFAGAYEAYLCRTWNLPSGRVIDDVGVYAEVFACFDAFARDGTL